MSERENKLSQEIDTDAINAANVPEEPSKTAVDAVLAALIPAAKVCVAGANDVTHVLVTFVSSGSVSKISVTGWAESNGKSNCIKGVLQSANVGPFSRPQYTFSFPLRP